MNNKFLLGILISTGLLLITLFSLNQLDHTEAAVDTDVSQLSDSEILKTAEINLAVTTKHASDNVILAKPADLEKKAFDDDWCLAQFELNDEDMLLAQSQVDDWSEYQGRARAKDNISMQQDDTHYTYNRFVASYQEMPIEQLTALAYNNDKWAMVTLVQHSHWSPGFSKVQAEIAKKLLVQGAAYYALEHLVIAELSAAKTSYQRSGNAQESIDHVIDALAYVFWGLDNYNEGGLAPYLANISRNSFAEVLKPLVLSAEVKEKARHRYLELTQWIKAERNKQGLNEQSPPIAAQKSFAQAIAILRHLHGNELVILSDLNISDIDRINNTPCVNEHEANLLEKLK
jgi:hypothetical protein